MSMSAETVITPHPTDPFCFVWSVGVELLGEQKTYLIGSAVLAPHKSMIQFESPCCWASLLPGEYLTCRECKTKYGSHSPARSSYGKPPSSFVGLSTTMEWISDLCHEFTTPLAADIVASSVSDGLLRAARLCEKIGPEMDAAIVNVDLYDRGESVYRQEWRARVPAIQAQL